MKSMLKKILVLLLTFVLVFSFPACEKKTPIDELTEKELVLFEALKIMTKDFFEPSGVKLLEVGDYNISVTDYFDREYDWYDVQDLHSDEMYKDMNDPYYHINLHKNLGYGEFEHITVRIQGENRVGGTLNHYYIVRLNTMSESITDTPEQIAEDTFNSHYNKKEDWDNISRLEFPRSNYDTWEEYKESTISIYYRTPYCTNEYAVEHFGCYYELDDYSSIESTAEDTFNIARINKALKYYWDERLGNN